MDYLLYKWLIYVKKYPLKYFLSSRFTKFPGRHAPGQNENEMNRALGHFFAHTG